MIEHGQKLDAIRQLADVWAVGMADWTDEERETFVKQLWEHFCIWCGRLGGTRCHCRNDK